MGILAMESIVLDSASRVRKRGSLQLQGNHDLTLSLCTSNNSQTSAGSNSMPGTPVGIHRGYRRSNSGQQISVICSQNDQELMCNRSRTRASTPGPTSMSHSRSQHQLQSSSGSGGHDMVYMTQGGAVVSQGGAAQRHSFGGSGQWMYMPRGLYYNSHHPSGRHSVHSHRTSWLIGELAGLYQPASPLKFHLICGDNVELNADASIAKRGDSFCKAICFSDRPIAVNEKVYIKFAETSSSWSGVLRFGFTNIDPGSLRGSDLPRYACPDMTNKQGNWAKALAERYATPNNTLHFYVTRNGDVFYGVNGEDVGLFFTGVNTSIPLWALFDIYGNTLAVEFANPEPVRLNNMVMSPTTSSSSSVSANRDLASSLSSLSINSAPNTETPGGFPAIRYYANLTFTPLKWHMLTGKNLQLSSDRVVATRSQDEYCNGYVFSSRPLKCGEKIIIQILGVDRSYVGGLAVGLTTCNPSRVQLDDLPDDSDLLLDRPEYWVVNKDVCRSPDVADELCFHLSNEGELRYSRNNQRVSTLLHVDRTLPLWIFFDVYGNVQKIRPLGTTVHLPPVPPRPRSTSYLGAQNSLTVMLPPRDQQPQAQNLANMTHANVDQSGVPANQNPQPHMLRSYSVPAATLAQMSPGPMDNVQKQPVSTPNTPNIVDNGDSEVRDECTVCYERQVNAALYMCGHLCMCFECAIQVKQRKGGLCPICRQEIKDVIRIYKT